MVHVPNECAAHHGTNDPFRDVSNVNDVQAQVWRSHHLAVQDLGANVDASARVFG